MRLLALVGLVGLLSGCGAGTEEAEAERTQSSPPESWCNSYKSKEYCPSVCAWYDYPPPGYCGLPAES